MLRSACCAILLCAVAPGQQFLVDPYLRNPSAWTVTQPALSSLVGWGPLAIETRVTNPANAGQDTGVAQNVTVPQAGYYQLVAHVTTAQSYGSPGALWFRCTLASGPGSVLDASGSSYYGPDARMASGFLAAGTYRLELVSPTIYDLPQASYQMVFEAVFLYAVDLPCPNLRLVSAAVPHNEQAELHGMWSAGATHAIGFVATHPQVPGIVLPGITGRLLLDATQGSGLIALPALTLPGAYRWWNGYLTPWPALYFQWLEYDPTQAPGSEWRLGSVTYSRF